MDLSLPSDDSGPELMDYTISSNHMYTPKRRLFDSDGEEGPAATPNAAAETTGLPSDVEEEPLVKERQAKVPRRGQRASAADAVQQLCAEPALKLPRVSSEPLLEH
jgi:hypothetical protein